MDTTDRGSIGSIGDEKKMGEEIRKQKGKAAEMKAEKRHVRHWIGHKAGLGWEQRNGHARTKHLLVTGQGLMSRKVGLDYARPTVCNLTELAASRGTLIGVHKCTLK